MSKEIQQVISKILILPNRPPFMLDRDVAELYETETFRINEAVKRNPERFPEDFFFQLTQEETEKVIANCDNLREALKFRPTLPHAFTREGCNMLSAVLNTPVAIDRSILIIRAFSAMEKGIFRFPGEAPDSPMLPNGWQMFELRQIHGVEGARKILKDFFGIYPDRYKFGITPWEAQVIRKDNPCREHRNKQIVELIERGVNQEQIAIMSGFSRGQVNSIYNVSKKLEAIEAGKYVE